MLKIEGRYGTALVYAREVSNSIWNRIFALVNSPMVDGAEIRIMPSTYVDGDSLVGLTISDGKGISPSILGSDLGCGTLCVRLRETDIDLLKLDSHIKRCIAIDKNKVPHRYANNIDLYRVRARIKKEDKMYYELGALGRGGHFIEVGKDSDNRLYLLVHSGSGNLGKQIHKYWSDIAYRSTKSEGYKGVSRELSWLEGAGKELYLEDISRALLYARWNRAAIVDVILSGMHLHDEWSIEMVHNYVSGGIVRRGAISSRAGERVVIPLTMADGLILGTGRGSKDWNYSAPSGLGKINTGKADISEYKKIMDGIYTTCINKKTLSESPQAYKSMDEVVPIISETVDIERIIKPIYNFKAC